MSLYYEISIVVCDYV